MKLYDAFGREVDRERLREEQAAPTMTGVRNIYSSMHPSVGLTPERLRPVRPQRRMPRNEEVMNCRWRQLCAQVPIPATNVRITEDMRERSHE